LKEAPPFKYAGDGYTGSKPVADDDICALSFSWPATRARSRGATRARGDGAGPPLTERDIDCKRFGACVYDETHDGYLDLRPEDELPRGHHGRSGIDILLEERPEWSEAAVSRLVSRSKEGRPETGYFGIGVVRGKTESNHGILWRSAYQRGLIDNSAH